MARPGALEGLVRDLREECAAAEPFFWLDEVDDASRPAIDREALRERDDFGGLLLKTTDALREADPAGRRFIAQQAEEIDRLLGKNRWLREKLGDLGLDSEHLLDASLDIALDLLVAQEDA